MCWTGISLQLARIPDTTLAQDSRATLNLEPLLGPPVSDQQYQGK
jgi:hypothetical protein